MHDDAQFRTEAGFSLPTNYQIEDRDTAFRLALAVFGTSCAAAVALGAQIIFG